LRSREETWLSTVRTDEQAAADLRVGHVLANGGQYLGLALGDARTGR
jgi:hypothetical protein